MGDELCYEVGLPASCCYANPDLGRTPYCGNWDMVTCQDDPFEDDGCDTDLYWCCDPVAQEQFSDFVNTANTAITVCIVLCCIAICRCCYRRRARMAHTATAQALREPLIVVGQVEPEVMAPGVEIQATATQVNPKGESP